MVFAFACAAMASAQTDDPPAKPADVIEEEIVDSIEVGDGKSPDGTASGQQEGVGEAPEYVGIPDIELKGEEADPEEEKELGVGDARDDAATETYATSRKNARTIAARIPAPRSLIVDRNGLPLAQTVVAYQLALKFGQFENEDRQVVLDFARNCIDEAHKIASQTWDFTDKDDMLWDHYQHRRWLPLPLTNAIRAEEAAKLKEKVDAVKGLELLPIYIRYYPEGKTVGHIVGYVGSKGKLPTGPINHMDPLWEESEGKSGLEKQFDAQLSGRPGVWRLMFDEEGTKILDELQVKPRPGGAIVTTIDLKWQKAAEKILEKHARRGAFILLDCQSGEILAMVSTPSFDSNKFIPNISQKDYDELRNDPGNPLLSRAFQGEYPPASTFKIITVFAALANGTLHENQMVYCPAALQIGNHTLNNWSKTPLGSANCIRALAMSNNPFMGMAALNLDGRRGANPRVSAKYLLDAAARLGFGQRTGLPIADKPGLLPDEAYMMRVHRRNFTQGDVANMSIGQGVLLSTPLQVVHAVAGIANGYGLPKLHLIKQIQDENGNVIYRSMPEIQTSLAGAEQAAATVRKGMRAVVEGGTGSRAKLSYTSIAGKTGTAQWGPDREKRRLAWFTGFLPCENPRFAFVALYEGRPHEAVGGSSKALPMVADFFRTMEKDVKIALNPALDDSIPLAEPVEEEPAHVVQPVQNNRRQVQQTMPDDQIPVAVPVDTDMDDSADTPRNIQGHPANRAQDESEVPGFVPQPGDPDYIPGLDEQIPRHLLPEKNKGNHRSAEEDIPVGLPLLDI